MGCFHGVLQLKVLHKEAVSTSPISSIAVTPDDAYVYLGCWDQQIVTFSVGGEPPPVVAPFFCFPSQLRRW